MNKFIKVTTPGRTYWQEEDEIISISIDEILGYHANTDSEELASTIINLKSGKSLSVKETVSEIDNLIK